MTASFIDTSVLVRYLTGDPPEAFETARAIVDRVESLAVTDVVIAETAYVLRSVYDVPRAVVVDTLAELLQKENLVVHSLEKELTLRALLLCRDSARVSFADAMVWAAARSMSPPGAPATVYTFDRRFPAEGVELRSGG
jgi:predicted nucleic acid-binding protein